MPLRQIELDMLAPGSRLDWDVVDSAGRVLLPKGMAVADDTQARALWTRGFLREDEPVRVAAMDTAPPPSLWRQPPRASDGGSVQPKFFQPVERLSLQLEEIFSELLNGKGTGLPDRILELSRGIQVQLQRDTDALLAALELSGATRYGTLHALHSAAVCELVAASRGPAADVRRTLVAAALTRDVGFLELQDELERQSDPLSEEQQEQVRLHPLESARLLRDAGVRDPAWLLAVEQHHERLNGSGYPRGVSGDAVQENACLLGIADIYSAMTKPRAYRPAIQSPNAVHSIFQTRGSIVDEELSQSFVRVLGLFAPGLMVRLASRETAVVTRRTENLKAPEVRVVADADEKLLHIYPARDILDPAYAIVEVLPRANPFRERLNHRQLWGEGNNAARR